MKKFKLVSGFTILELMVVIAIIGILGVVAYPKYSSSREHFKMYTTARECIADIRYAQQLSIDSKIKYGIYFTSQDYSIKRSDTLEVIKKITFNRGITYEQIQGLTDNVIIFGTDGTPFRQDGIMQYNNAAIINFKSSYSNSYVYINVTPKTGGASLSWN